jgi:integrase
MRTTARVKISCQNQRFRDRKMADQNHTEFKLAKDVELKLKTLKIENQLFDKKEENRFNFDWYLKFAQLHKKSWKDDRNRWNRYIAGKKHNSSRGIQEILDTLKHLSPQTVRHVLNLIRRVYNWHIEQGYWHSANPCLNIKTIKFDNTTSTILDQNRVKILTNYLDTWGNRRAALVILFALCTGRRKGEILNLKWGDVSADLRYITCRATKNGTTISFPLNSKAMAILREASTSRLAQCDFVFPSSTGHHFHSGLPQAWRRMKERLRKTEIIDLKSFRFHDLRHTYASLLASSGQVDIYTLKTLLGHKDIKLTERYSHLSDERLRSSTEVLDNLF